jgi:hypothetical protein
MRFSHANSPALITHAQAVPGVRGRCALLAVICACWLGGLSVSAQATTGYSLNSSFSTSGHDAQAITVDQTTEDAYVAAFVTEFFSPGEIQRFSAVGDSLNTFGSAYFSGVAVDPLDHDVYAYDVADQTIDASDASGDPVDVFEGGTSSALPVTGGDGDVQIATDAVGDIYYPNQASKEVQKFQPDGQPGTVTIAGLTSPTDVAVAPTGTIYVLDTNSSTGETQVQQFDSSGAPIGTGIFGAGVLSNPHAITVDASGDVYVIDDIGDEAVVDELDSSGARIRAFGAGLVQEGDSIAVDSTSGAVYVLRNPGFFSAGAGSIFEPSAVTVPAATTGSATGLDPNDELVTGTVNPEGTDTKYHFAYGTSPTYGQQAPTTEPNAHEGAANVQAIAVLANLEPNQTYHYRVVATDAEGDRTYGGDETFTTQSVPPLVSGETVSGISQTDATLEAQINPNNQATTYYFEYGTSPTLSGATTVPPRPGTELGSGFGDQTASQDIGGGLSANTTYYYRVITVNSTGTTEGAIEHFATLPLAPTVDTEAPSSVTQNAATLNGILMTQNAETTYSFEYVDERDFQSSGYEFAQSVPQPELSTTASPEPTVVAVGVSGLEPDTMYHVRLVATNAGGATEETEQTFETLIALPEVSTGLPVSVAATTATVQGGINPEGGEAAYSVEYGTTIAYGRETATAHTEPSTGPQPVTATMTYLTPGTTYQYRVVATNSSGTTVGQDQSFTTPAEGGTTSGTGGSPFGSGAATGPPRVSYPSLTSLDLLLPPTRITPTTRTSKPLTKAQKLAKALRACKKAKSKQKRQACEKSARKRYGPKPKPKKKKK